MNFEIVPYIGALPIEFGMTECEVVPLLGEPKTRSKTFEGRNSHGYETMSIGYSDEGKVNYIGFLPGSDVELGGVNPFDPSGFEKFIRMDGEPMEVLGAVILLNLGIATDRFHFGEDGGKGVSLFVRGEYDDVRHRMKPFKFHKDL